MKFTLQLLESSREIEKNILSTLKILLEQAIDSSIRDLSDNIKDIVKAALQSEPEYGSLKSGELRYNFGISDPSNIDVVISKLVDTIEIEIKPIKITSKGLSGGYTINMMNSQDFGGVLNIDASMVVDEKGGYKLPWLEWLLLRNNEFIVKDYEVQLGPNSSSRTGNAIMVRSNNSWRVPPAFAGSQESNWTTRALEKVDREIIMAMENTLVSKL
jgi:hypothetical protein